MYEKVTLGNGLRVVTANMPRARSVSISFFIGTGSRYESPQGAGVSHFVEHLCFKGTTRRPTSKEIAEAVEGVGGVLNGGTDRELTIYWCKVPTQHFPLAVDVLVDMLRYSLFDKREMERERQVILEEINTILDSPHERVDVLIDEVLWPQQALGREVIGTKETVSALTQEDVLSYFGCQYNPANIVVSIAGNITQGEVLDLLSPLLEDWPVQEPHGWYPAEDGQKSPHLRLETKKTEQAHLCIAVRGLSIVHPDRYILDLLNVILGEGMSSRLFLQVRERLGLAYDIHSYVSHFLDSGSMAVHAAVHPPRLVAAVEAILEQLQSLKEETPLPELQRAKEFSKGRLVLRMEDTRSVAGWIGAQELLTGRIRTVDEVVALLDAITPEDLVRVARQLLVTEKLNLAVVAPLRGEKRLESLLKI
ncbi:MAG: insulinase family protein [Chloroflexi bacterium]|nr:insulinase family protein [Chloroflexota bacterium]